MRDRRKRPGRQCCWLPLCIVLLASCRLPSVSQSVYGWPQPPHRLCSRLCLCLLVGWCSNRRCHLRSISVGRCCLVSLGRRSLQDGQHGEAGRQWCVCPSTSQPSHTEGTRTTALAAHLLSDSQQLSKLPSPELSYASAARRMMKCRMSILLNISTSSSITVQLLLGHANHPGPAHDSLPVSQHSSESAAPVGL